MTEPIKGRALLTGASGFIGSRLRDDLLARGFDVVAIRRKSSPEPKQGRAAVAEYDDVDALRELMKSERPEYVFHVAGATKGVTYEDFQRGNVLPTRNLLRAVKEAGLAVGRFLHVSSLAAFGPSAPERPKREEDPRQPVEHYGRSKAEAEEALEAEREVPWTIIRPAGVYGPGDVDNFELFKWAHRRVNLFYGNRRRWLSAVFVDDVIRSIVEASQASSTVGRGYFICDGTPRTWDEYQEHIVRATRRRAITLDLPGFFVPIAGRLGEIATSIDGKPRLYNQQKATMGAQEAWTCTHENARKDFGYAPTVDLEEGAERTYRWYRENGWL